MQVAFLIEMCPQVAAVRPVGLVSQGDNSPITLSRIACHVSTSLSLSVWRNRSDVALLSARPIARYELVAPLT